eukprot:gnl/MRDRNA2_/MRDRNA2_77197_c0_seq1.p1 gnl/MRDRNA2_/MRDRNA2_77197_c0~~gnl/MRDRNA2_/MRDRNA2_77197_c0_seq1.p1  ORF type:complete len:190 (+),score=26.86 gnl/MRDRNA2_/MRDRNA2_77197_c0_seq1:323-892(+)
MMGSSFLLEELGFACVSRSFALRAAHVISPAKSESLLGLREPAIDNSGALGNACSLAEYHVTLPCTETQPLLQLDGSLLRKNGFSDRARQSVDIFGERVHGTQVAAQMLHAVRFARNRIDRRACSEFRLLCQLAALEPARPSGTVQLFISRAPCISCIGAMIQFQRLCPDIALLVGFPGNVGESQFKDS